MLLYGRQGPLNHPATGASAASLPGSRAPPPLPVPPAAAFVGFRAWCVRVRAVELCIARAQQLRLPRAQLTMASVGLCVQACSTLLAACCEASVPECVSRAAAAAAAHTTHTLTHAGCHLSGNQKRARGRSRAAAAGVARPAAAAAAGGRVPVPHMRAAGSRRLPPGPPAAACSTAGRYKAQAATLSSRHPRSRADTQGGWWRGGCVCLLGGGGRGGCVRQQGMGMWWWSTLGASTQVDTLFV